MAEKFLRLVQQCAAEGITIFLVHGLRTFEEQERLYRQGRQDPGPIVTNARPGESAHNFGKAVDIAFRPAGHLNGASWDGPWPRVAEIAKTLGLVWGGNWKIKDTDHFELPNWKENK